MPATDVQPPPPRPLRPAAQPEAQAQPEAAAAVLGKSAAAGGEEARGGPWGLGHGWGAVGDGEGWTKGDAAAEPFTFGGVGTWDRGTGALR